jgi:glycosyltransferase involved in cell wall biosynthesis
VTKRLPPVTIGIPFYNAEATLLDAVRSVFAQTHQDWELILLDDGSTDRSLELARSIRDPRVKVYSDGQNRRLAARLNEIARLACHDFIVRMDADDLMSVVRLERQMDILVSRPDVDLVTTGICSLSDDYEPLGTRCVPSSHLITPDGLLLGKSGIVHAAITGRRAWFLRNPYNEKISKGQDTNLWVRAFSRGDLKVYFMREPYYYYREDGNVSRDRLLAAYKSVRHTILNDAKHHFGLGSKVRAFAASVVKPLSVRFLDRVGRLDVIRNRRNSSSISTEEYGRLVKEIEAIRGLELLLEQNDQ